MNEARLNNLFLIIGAQRSGTTYLYSILGEHPQICTAKPMKPEPKFFLYNEYFLGKDFYFQKYFSHRNSSNKIFIEKSTSYYEYEIVPQRLVGEFSNTKIIFVIRNPVERAISNYFFSKKNGLESRTIEEVFLYDKPLPEYSLSISTNPFNYLERGNYLKYIKMYLKYIKKRNFIVLFYEDIIKNINAVQNLFLRLNITKDFIPPSFKKVINKSQNNNCVSDRVIDKLNKYYEQSIKDLREFLAINFKNEDFV